MKISCQASSGFARKQGHFARRFVCSHLDPSTLRWRVLGLPLLALIITLRSAAFAADPQATYLEPLAAGVIQTNAALANHPVLVPAPDPVFPSAPDTNQQSGFASSEASVSPARASVSPHY